MYLTDLMEYGLILVCGLASLLGSLAGFGGGIFVIPVMVMGFNIPIEVAIGVTAISLFPSSLVSTLANWRNKHIDFKVVGWLTPPTVLGAYLGANLTSFFPTRPMETIFSLFLIFLSWRMSKPVKIGEPTTPLSILFAKLNNFAPHLKDRPYRVGLWASSVFGTCAGIVAGLFGIGGGILVTPMMLKIFKVPLRTATGTSLAMIVITSFVSGWTHFSLKHYEPEVLTPSFIGFLGGALIGVWMGFKFKDQLIARMISVSILMAGIATLIHSIL